MDSYRVINDFQIAYDLIMLHADDLKEYALTRFNGEEQGVKINIEMPMLYKDKMILECGSSEGLGFVEIKYDEFRKFIDWKYNK